MGDLYAGINRIQTARDIEGKQRYAKNTLADYIGFLDHVLVGYNIYMTPLSLIRRLFQGSLDKCVLSLFLDAEPVKSDIRAGLVTGFD